jgi:hypothetical protein
VVEAECPNSKHDRYTCSVIQHNKYQLGVRWFILYQKVSSVPQDISRRLSHKIPRSNPIKDARGDHCEMIRATYHDRTKKTNEMAIISMPHAISYPRAMMIHTQYASKIVHEQKFIHGETSVNIPLACFAVMSTRGLISSTRSTKAWLACQFLNLVTCRIPCIRCLGATIAQHKNREKADAD